MAISRKVICALAPNAAGIDKNLFLEEFLVNIPELVMINQNQQDIGFF